jgi:predicted GIY-YIG superfamily endonuclease
MLAAITREKQIKKWRRVESGTDRTNQPYWRPLG